LLKEGAYDYIVKDDDAKERIWNTVMHARENSNLRDEITQLKEEIGKKYEFTKIIKGNSPAIKQIFSLMEKAAKTNITVSVTGETGTGKELVAKAIHYNSTRAKKSFVAVNVAAIPKELIESELFGHEKGAFTGAAARRIGKFEEAHGGTLFLDEIGEMDLNMQSKLLRVLQEREVTRVGSNQVVKIDVRLIVATHRDLADEVRKKAFREDLYFRLLGLPIKVPPLRQRSNDIILLAKFFADEFAKENKIDKISISSEAQKKLMKYPFPGNVRELRAIMELATVMSDAGIIEEDHINFNSATTLSDMMMEETTLKEYTNRIIQHFLQKYDNNVLLVAEKLDIGKSTIYRMLKNEEI
jgi:DNA-binding NtrC family response regulator